VGRLRDSIGSYLPGLSVIALASTLILSIWREMTHSFAHKLVVLVLAFSRRK
jgi:hypothetical protein